MNFKTKDYKFNSFITRYGKPEYVRQYLLLILLCIIFFFLPLQVFIIGDFSGIGVQGAVYRYQTSVYGTASMLIPREINYITMGIYGGKTALSVILWGLGTAMLACTMAYSFIHAETPSLAYYRQVTYGLIVSCVIYLTSCIAQYGILFSWSGGNFFSCWNHYCSGLDRDFTFFPRIIRTKIKIGRDLTENE